LGQSLSGYIQDETNAPVPFANVYVKNTSTGTTTNAEGKYFLRFKDPGSYDIVVSSVGYETSEIKITFEDNKEVVKNIWLKTNQKELDEVLVKSKKRDPAYAIINAAVKAKQNWAKQYNSSTSNVYIKAKEIVTEKEKRKRQKEKDAKAKLQQEENDKELDVFDVEKRKQNEKINKIAYGMNMVEVQMIRHYQYPNKVKEIREGFKKLGNTRALFYTSTSEADFNFYDNLMSLDKLNELPVVSPLHSTSVLTYKFKLEKTTFIGEKMLYKIKVTPRKKGNATWEGHIWILDDLYCIIKTDLSLDKHGLLILNAFNIKQEYQFDADSTLLLTKQEFVYSSKSGKSIFNGKTTVSYSDYVINPTFEKRFFGNEVAVTTQKAYEQDTSYWSNIRPEPLTVKEQEYQRVKDSITAFLQSDIYLDSIDSVYNKITLLDVLWDGVGFSNRKKKRRFYYGSLLGMVDPFSIGGLRIDLGPTYFKKWKNEKFLYLNPGISYGLRNQDIKYSFWGSYRYDPMHQGMIGIYAGKLFNTIVENDALSNLFSRSNWIEEKRLTFITSRELFNGFEAHFAMRYIDRYPIDQLKFGNLTSDWFDGNPTLSFQNYQTTKLTLTLFYTPFRKYMTEPYRKIILGSKWPTFRFHIERAVPNLFGSDVDYTYLAGGIKQSFKIGTLGTFNYNASVGKFVTKKDLRYVDYVIFPRGDKWFFSSMMESMQSQDTTLTVQDTYYKLHFRHHFNGAIVNYIPLVKKLGLHAVIGGSTLYIKESNYKYVEAYVGVERSFKAQRARYRIGVYFVEATSNYSSIPPRIKFAISRYSLRDQTWGY